MFASSNLWGLTPHVSEGSNWIVSRYNSGYEFINWDRQVAGTTNNLSFPFQFRFTLPRSRKEREIVLRNHLGQIIVSKVPDICYAEGGR